MSAPVLVCMGNPLLDMQASNAESVLAKYDLKDNDAILVDEPRVGIYDHIRENFELTYVAGGAAQNTCRAAQYVLPENSTAYLGCVGTDDLANQLRAANEKEGVNSAYQVVDTHPTGACAVLLTGHHRSLVTQLGAAEQFQPSHLEKPEIKALIESAKYFYLGGFFLTHGIESSKALAQHALDNRKIFAMNLSAPFIAQFFKAQVDEILPYVDILIGNEDEAVAFAEAHELGTKDLSEIAIHIASFKKLASRPRIVVITHGPKETIVASSTSASATPSVKVHPVQALPDDKIVDTNGAGDAFAGGFIGAYILGKSVDDSIEVGHRLGQMCVSQVGPQLRFPKENVL